MIDAVADTVGQPGGTVGASFNVATNDQFPTGSVFSIQPGSTCAAPTVSSVGVASYNVPATGSCTVNYQVCTAGATGVPPEPCDQATLTVTASAADMSPAFAASTPTVVSPGQSFTGLTLTCTNSTTAAASATGATCAPTVSAGAITNLVCVPPSGSNVAPGSSIVCTFDYAAPGTAGGADEATATVIFTGTTGAANDSNLGNNTTTVSINIIDAVNDALAQVNSTTGGTTASVLGNDAVGTNPATTTAPANVAVTANGAQGFTGTGTASVLTLNADGTITVPANATPGVYTVPYQACARPAVTPDACDTAVATVTVSGAPALRVTKLAGSPTVGLGVDPNKTDAGDTITYSFSVANTGNIALTNVTISDPKLPTLTCTTVASLAVGASQAVVCTSGNVYTLTAADVAAGSATNVATATGTAPPDTCATAPCNVTGTSTSTVPTAPNGGITVNKLANPGTFTAAGNVISYTILVENTGTVALTNVNVTDPKAGAVTCTGGNPIASVAVNASVTCSASYTVTAADVAAGSMTNVARATGTAPPNTCATPPCTVTGSGTTTVVTPTNAPQLKVVKQASPKTVSTVGQVIDYTIVGTNTGNVALTNVSISDTKVTALTCVPVAPTTLGLGATITCTGSYTLTAADAASGSVSNVATGMGTPPSGPPVTGTGTSTTPVVPAANDDFDNTALNTPVTTLVSPNDQYPTGSTVSAGATSTNGGTVTCTSATPASCTYTPATGFVGTDTYVYTLCLPAPNQAVCDSAIVTVTVSASDMGVQITGLPATAGPGAVLTGTLTCTNTSTGTAALNPTCTAAAGTPAGATVVVSACSPALPVASLAAGAAIRCTVTVTMPANPADSNVVPTSVGVNGSTSATNDNNLGNNTTTVSINIIDAVNDAAVTAYGITATLSVLGNDQNGSIAATTGNVVITAVAAPTPGSTFDTVTGVFTVPGTALPGTYTVTYQICTNPATIPPGCDTATATIVVASGSALSGTVFDDGTGLTDFTVNGTGTNAGGLTAYLVNTSTGLVVTSVPVAASGAYVFPLVANGTYSIVISATAGQTSNPTTNLPSNWVTTGEGANPSGDGVPDGRITGVIVSGASLSALNFGIEQRPVAGGSTLPSQTNPGAGASVAVPGSAFQTGTSDADGVVTSYVITAMPGNATSITINGIVYTATGTSGSTAFPVGGVVVPAANIGSVSVDPLDGVVNVAIAFTVNDNAGFASANSGTVNVPFSQPSADLAVQKNGPAAAPAGSVVIYTITLINNGLSAANGASFVDTLPTGLTGVTAVCSATSGTGTSTCAAIPVTVAAGTVSGSVPSFPSGGGVVITIRGTAPASGPITNSVTITPPPGVLDPIPSNNTSTVTTSIGTPPLDADIAVIKTGPAAALAGSTISYVIDVVNGGPGVATGATFTDIVPASVTGVIWTCTASGQAICPAASGAGNNITQTLTVMPMNGRLRYAISGTLTVGATASVVNTATVTSPPGVNDPNPGNNTSTVTTTITTPPLPQANLSMSKIGPTTIAAGGIVRYTLVATNNGPSAADGAIVNDTFPNALINPTWTCVASVGAACGSASGSGNLALTIPTFAAGSQVTITVTATAPNSGTFQNSARVTTPPTVTDPDPTDNIGGPVITTVLMAPADLVTTVVVGSQAATGQPVTATVTAGNIGPSPAGNVTVTLRIPSGSTAVTPSSGGIYDPATNTISWPIIVFVPASTNPLVTYTVSFVPPATGGTLQSNVRTADTEVTLTNNPASTTLQIVAIAAPEPIPTTPWWVLALGLLFFARRGLMKSASNRRN